MKFKRTKTVTPHFLSLLVCTYTCTTPLTKDEGVALVQAVSGNAALITQVHHHDGSLTLQKVQGQTWAGVHEWVLGELSKVCKVQRANITLTVIDP